MAENKKLLIVDDDLMDSELLAELLLIKGIELIMTDNVPSALKELDKIKFDLIIIDIGLAGKDNGLDLLKAIRKTDKQIRIFVLTGYGKDYYQQSLALGADHYFEKPLDIDKHILKPLGVK